MPSGSAGRFFLGVAPVAPHSNLNISAILDMDPDHPEDIDISKANITAPIPAKRHQHLFKGLKVPRNANFNPEKPSGANWIRTLPRQTQENIDYNDHFFRQRLRALQSVDELVEGLVGRLEEYGILETPTSFTPPITVTTSDSIASSRARNAASTRTSTSPLIVRGPGVPEGLVTDIVTTHTDLAPTILNLIGAPLRADFDGEPIPLSKSGLAEAAKSRHEHVTVEFWGFAGSEGGDFGLDRFWLNNTYKALRIISGEYNLYYSVWCTNEHELYDLTVSLGLIRELFRSRTADASQTDPYQVKNLLHPDEAAPSSLLGLPLSKVVARLDSLLFVLKSCQGQSCVHPWRALHPSGNVGSLREALSRASTTFTKFNRQGLPSPGASLATLSIRRAPSSNAMGSFSATESSGMSGLS